MEIVKKCEAALEARVVVGGRGPQPADERLDAAGLGPAELAVLDVDVMHDLADAAPGRGADRATAHLAHT
jgi:hypothetical protein